MRLIFNLCGDDVIPQKEKQVIFKTTFFVFCKFSKQWYALKFIKMNKSEVIEIIVAQKVLDRKKSAVEITKWVPPMFFEGKSLRTVCRKYYFFTVIYIFYRKIIFKQLRRCNFLRQQNDSEVVLNLISELSTRRIFFFFYGTNPYFLIIIF